MESDLEHLRPHQITYTFPDFQLSKKISVLGKIRLTPDLNN